MLCQGLQISRVRETAGNLQFDPTRLQAEQLLEQKLTLRRRVMLCETLVGLVSRVSRCLIKGSSSASAGSASLTRLHTDLLENNCFPSNGTPGKCSWSMFHRNVGGYNLTKTLYLFGSGRHCFLIHGVQVPDRWHQLNRVLCLLQQTVEANREREVGSAIHGEREVVWDVLHEHNAGSNTCWSKCMELPLHMWNMFCGRSEVWCKPPQVIRVRSASRVWSYKEVSLANICSPPLISAWNEWLKAILVAFCV